MRNAEACRNPIDVFRLATQWSDMTRKNRMETALAAALNPTVLEVEDESGKHFGHAGARPEGETHYRVLVVSEAFRGKTRVDRHRTVNALLADEFAKGLHALALTAKTPEEAAP